MALTVSIITPSLNQGQFSERTIRSVLSQGVGEYVVIDGGSTDGTLDILRRYEERLRWVSAPDRGQAHAINKGIAATRGEIIGWLSSDDVYYGAAIARAVAAFEQGDEVDVAYGRANHIDADDKVIAPYPTEPWNLRRLKETCFLCQPAAFVRRGVIDRFGALDESLHYCMDYEYWLRLGLGGARFRYVSDVLAGSRLHPSAKTLRRRLEAHREVCTMMKRRLGRVPGAWLLGYGKAWAESRGWGRCRRARFGLAAIAVSAAAALRWNRGLDGDWCRTAARWVGRHA
jgi:glycosyltransferase involved in cell wall biosynthesis